MPQLRKRVPERARRGKREPPLPASGDEAPPFWRTKTLEELSPAEWESLCDGCGRCCLNKLEDEDTGEIEFTAVACKLLDGESCQCGDYAHRFDKVPDCIQLTPAKVRAVPWLPPIRMPSRSAGPRTSVMRRAPLWRGSAL